MEQHFILCGLGRVGWRVLDYLRAAGAAVTVIDTRCAPDDPRLGQAVLVQGDCRRQDILEKAGLAKARGVLILLSDDLICISSALMVRSLNPDVRVIVRMFNQNIIARLGSAVQNVFALSTSALTAPVLALIARTGEALGIFRLEDGRPQQVAEIIIHGNSPLAGQKIKDIAAQNKVLPVAHFSAAGNRFLNEIDGAMHLASGDRLAVCGEPAQMRNLLAAADDESLPELLWAGNLRRLSRVLRRTLGEIDLPVKICTSVLLVVIFISVIVFRFGMEKDAWADAFFRAISLIATGADMHGDDFQPGAWQKVYVSLLRICGAALIATFTAIVTNYLIRANLGGALEVRRIPDRGHTIVCGLGNVGFRVVEELVRQGERIVAIERARDNHFISTARRLGVAVIIGDTTVAEVLRQANAASAKAVIAVTSNELVNLEVALLAKQLAPNQRIVVRITDPHLARTLREAAGVRLALSIPELAAPAFVAALFGDRVRGVILLGGRLLVAVDLVVQSGDRFLENQPVRVLSIDYNLLPVGLLDADNKPCPHPLEVTLQAGNRLTAIMALNDLQRLLQREPPPSSWAVDVLTCPETLRPVLVQILQGHQIPTGQDGSLSSAMFPLCVNRNLTRGQAEQLVLQLEEAQINSRLRPNQHETAVIQSNLKIKPGGGTNLM